MTQQTRRNLSVIAKTTLVCAAAGMIFSYIFSGTIFTGLIIGTSIAVAAATMEMFVFNSSRVKKLRTSIFFLINFIFYIFIISLPIILVNTIIAGIPLQRLLYSKIYWYGFIFGIILTFIILFIRNINALIGPGILLKFVMGRYFHPREEQRIFMFLDLNSSTAIAEQIGHLRFHSLLSDFFFDISMPILHNKGEVYKYVGDEIIVTWDIKNGTHNASMDAWSRASCQ
jgi:adenylate cyclase